MIEDVQIYTCEDTTVVLAKANDGLGTIEESGGKSQDDGKSSTGLASIVKGRGQDSGCTRDKRNRLSRKPAINCRYAMKVTVPNLLKWRDTFELARNLGYSLQEVEDGNFCLIDKSTGEITPFDEINPYEGGFSLDEAERFLRSGVE